MRRLLFELLCPPRCIACGTLMPPAVGGATVPFCASCREAWERERVADCPECFQPIADCKCVPKLMQKAGVTRHVKLMLYGEDASFPTTRRVIATVKRRGSSRAFRYLAEELKPAVLAAVRDAKNERGTRPETVVSFLPRGVEAKREIGYDQAQRLAKALSEATGLPYQQLFTREKRGIAQKLLRRRDRVKNVHNAFSLRQEVYGKRVILVDDLVTTGAGMAEAAGMLLRADAADVIAVSIALTKKKQREKDYFSR